MGVIIYEVIQIVRSINQWYIYLLFSDFFHIYFYVFRYVDYEYIDFKINLDLFIIYIPENIEIDPHMEEIR